MNRFYRRYGKRTLDILFSGAALLVLSPVLIVISILVRLNLGRPVLFKQARPGLRERIFYIYKFRTMKNTRGNDGKMLEDEERLTRFGKALRATSLDELPELWNVLRGDMSIVGPRPLLVKYLPLYSEAQKKRHNVRPGLTGLAQINGRNSLSWQERFAFDIEYVNKISLGQDIKIILKTLQKVAKQEGIHSEASVTMEDFKGNA